MLSEQSSVAVDVFVRLLRAHASLTRELSARLLAEHGLTINDYEALLSLSRAEANRMRPVDLAGGLLLTPSGVTRLLEGLERAGLVGREQCPADRRVTYAVLSDDGRARLRAAAASHVAAVEELVGRGLDREELAQLAELLGRLPGAGGDGEACTPGA